MVRLNTITLIFITYCHAWWGPLRHNRGPTEEEVPIKSGTYNIRNGPNGGLEAALRGMEQANLDMGILQETKITNGVYTARRPDTASSRRTL